MGPGGGGFPLPLGLTEGGLGLHWCVGQQLDLGERWDAGMGWEWSQCQRGEAKEGLGASQLGIVSVWAWGCGGRTRMGLGFRGGFQRFGK